MATLTLWGIENYLKSQNKSVFDNLVLPDGIVKNDVVDNIMLRAGEFEVLYSNPDFLTEAIAVWGRKHFRTFLKWYEALQIEYNPLENYDRIEDWDDTANTTANSSDVVAGSQNSTNSTTSEVIGRVSAFDSSTFSDKDKTSATDSVTGNSTTSTNTNTNSTIQDVKNHNGRIHGNIGVTTSQQMLESELDVAKWNLIDNITDLYISEFCVAVY